MVRTLDITNFIPDDFEWQVDGGAIRIKISRCELTLKRNLQLDEEFMEVMGMYYGDGLKSTKGSGNRQVYFSNSEVSLHKKWIKFLVRFGFALEQLYYQLSIGEKNNISNSELLNYWQNELSAPANRFGGVSIKKGVATSEYGTLILAFHNKIFAKIFRNIYYYSLSLLDFVSFELKAAFARGLFAAEGCVFVNRSGSLNHLGICAGTQEGRDFIRKLLTDLGVRVGKDSPSREVIVTSFLTFQLLRQIGIAALHPSKDKKFECAYGNAFRHTKNPDGMTKLKILDCLQEMDGADRYKLSEQIGKSESAVHKSLRDLELKGLVGRRRAGFRDDWFLISYPQDIFRLIKSDYTKND